MKILITGGAGYIGSVLTQHLIDWNPDHKVSVTVLDNFLYRQTSLAHLVPYNDLIIVRGDARNISLLESLLPKHDVVIALAAIVGAPACDLDETAARTTNSGAIYNLCNLMSEDQCLLYPNTNSGYGIGSDTPCTEETPLEPISLYGSTKVQAERVVMERRNSISLRLATVFGVSPRMRTDLLLNDFVRRAVADGYLGLYEPAARRNFVHVQDVAHAFIHAIKNFETMRGNTYNCGDTRANMTKAELCNRIINRAPQFRWATVGGEDTDKRDYLVSNAKLEATGWKPQFTIDDGIKELARYYIMSGGKVEGNVL